MKILVVEDDKTSQLMLKTMLSEHELTIVDSGESCIEVFTSDSPDLVILDIKLPGIDGYETCRKIREYEDKHVTPVLFLSSYSDLEDRLQAYGSGGNDYISKPFDVKELLGKIKIYQKNADQRNQVEEELSHSHKLLLELQSSAAKIQSISRFIQATLFCHDTNMLFKFFFKTAHEIGVSCILQIETDKGFEVRSSDIDATTLEREILELSHSAKRIHTFGHDRAIFRWSSATLLTRKVGDMIDTLALFMDALEAGIKAVNSESRLLSQVESLETQNAKVQKRVTALFKLLNEELRNAILSLGLVSALDLDEEDHLQNLVDSFNKRIDTELKTLDKNNQIMKSLISDLRTPPPELKSLMDLSEKQEIEDDVFF